MITKTEFTYLKGLKKFKDMPQDQMERELINLIGNENGFKIFKKKIQSLEKELDKANKKIERTEQTMKRKDKKIFDLSMAKSARKMESKNNPKKRIEGKEKTQGYAANVHQLKRILCLLEVEKGMTKSEIFRIGGLVHKQGSSALNFLTNHNLIKCTNGEYSTCL